MKKDMSMTKAEVMAIEAPAFTKSWHPVSHGTVITAMSMILESQKIGVVRERYTVTSNGMNLFGCWVLDIGNGTKIQLGFRNSTAKLFALGLAAGTFVMVCSNMCFSGEFIEFRKHTAKLDFDEILEIGSRSIHTVLSNGEKMIEWQDDLHKKTMNENLVKLITYDAMDEGILPPSKFAAFKEAYVEEILSSGENTLYEFHGAVTRLSREDNLFTINTRTKRLNGLCDRYVAVN